VNNAVAKMTDNIFESINSSLLLLTFLLDGTVYGIDMSEVQEVMRVGKITPVHSAPTYVAGVYNLRGQIVTVIDLRLRLELGSVDDDLDRRMIIVKWKEELIGLLVDRISDTVTKDPDRFVLSAANMNGVSSCNLLGIFQSNEHLVGMLDLDVVLTPNDSPQKSKLNKRVMT
jgi:purine-binding chemotaxis protein CheW